MVIPDHFIEFRPVSRAIYFNYITESSPIGHFYLVLDRRLLLGNNSTKKRGFCIHILYDLYYGKFSELGKKSATL